MKFISIPHCVRRAAVALTVSLAAASALAVPLTLNVLDPDRTGPAGATYSFTGSITNNTGSALNASDLFLDFNGFDFGSVSLSQLLGTPDFVIAAGTTSAVVSLFDFTLAPDGMAGVRYVADVGVSDAIGDLSDSVTVSVTAIPEPTTTALMALGLAGVALARRRRNSP